MMIRVKVATDPLQVQGIAFTCLYLFQFKGQKAKFQVGACRCLESDSCGLHVMSLKVLTLSENHVSV